VRLLDVDVSWVTAPGRHAGISVVHDITAGVLTGVLRVTGDGQFSLTAADAQHGRVALWGDALAGFCRERLTVCRVLWQQWSTSTRCTRQLRATFLCPGGLGDAAVDCCVVACRRYDSVLWASPQT
jgi:hypothetical protein